MLRTKFRENWPACFGEEDYGKVFTIYRCGGHLGHVTSIMEGDLSKKSIHINESFVHAIYIGIVVNSYSDIVAYI